MRETRGTEKRTLPVALTATELLDRGDQLARAHQAVRIEQAEQKAKKEDLKQRLEDLEGEVGKLARIVRDKSEPRDVECARVFDFDKSTVEIVRTDTGEVVSSRTMTDQERQIGLPHLSVQ